MKSCFENHRQVYLLHAPATPATQLSAVVVEAGLLLGLHLRNALDEVLVPHLLRL